MPYDPNFPTANTLADAEVMRGQLNSLNDKIDAGAILTVVFDSIVMLPPGEAPSGTASFVGNVLHLNLSIPIGATGAPGADGTNGADGATGATGATGEVTSGQLAASIATTAMNPVNVAELNLGSSNAEIQQLEAKLNEHIAANKRV